MATPELEYDRTLLGREVTSQPVKVEQELILKYCRATGITNPLHTDEEAARDAGYRGLVAPFTMYTFLARDRLPDIKLNFGRRGLFANLSIEPLAPVCAGDVLQATTCLRDVYGKTGRSGTMVFVVWETSFTNQLGENVVRVRESWVRRE